MGKLKKGRTKVNPETQEIQYIPSRELSYEQLVEQDWHGSGWCSVRRRTALPLPAPSFPDRTVRSAGSFLRQKGSAIHLIFRISEEKHAGKRFLFIHRRAARAGERGGVPGILSGRGQGAVFPMSVRGDKNPLIM